jgi:hypothetical protein
MNWQRSDPVPALLVHPPDAASLDEAHAAIEQWEHYSHKTLDSAQRLAVELMMAESSDGRWAARSTGRAESRQNGKGDEIEVVEAWGLTQRSEAIVHTAHEIPTAKSAHERLVAHLYSHSDLRRKVKKVGRGNGNQTIEMRNDGIVVYRTRTGAGGRGLDDISRLVVDEAQHAQPEQLASSTPIMAANPNPQTNFIGSGGIADRSAWWWEMRLRALFPDAGQFSWIEHSAEIVRLNDQGKVETLAPEASDRGAWRRANPAYPARIADEFLAEQLRTLGAPLFSREHLCVWDPEPGEASAVIAADVWDALAEKSAIASHRTWALSVSPDRKWSTFGIAGRREDGRLHVEWLERRAGTDWVLEYAVEVWGRQRVPLRVHKSGPESSFITSLAERGVDVVEVASAEVAQATGQFIDAANGGGLRHLGQAALTAALRGAVLRTQTDGAALWSQRSSQVEITALMACTVAAGGVPAESAHMVNGFVDLSSFLDEE